MNGIKAGIDEAGRGCVIGPLVMAAVECDEEILKRLRVKDSKLLTPSRRRELYREIRKYSRKVSVVKMSAEEINEAMKQKINLNDIEAMMAARLLKRIRAKKVIIDCPDPTADLFSKRLLRLDGRILDDRDILLEHKADVNHPVVSAASIIAKEVREREIRKIKKVVGEDFGSGYAHDPVTREFLKKHMKDEKIRPFLRVGWKTLSNIREELAQTKLERFIQ